jgi:pilus assembly protein Flp/PilA
MTQYRLHLIACVLCFASFISERLQANVILPTAAQLQALGATQYEIAFVTSQGTTATSSNIATYNSFVTSQANSGSLSSLGATWNAIVSTGTAGVNSANVNAPSSAGIPVFNTDGQLVAFSTSASPLYSGATLTNNIDYDQNGNQQLYQAVWTGSTSNGTANVGSTLGSPETTIIGIDSNGTLGTTWIAGPPFLPNSSPLPLYALSSPITPVPEPATLSLVGAALFGVVGASFVRKRKQSLLRKVRCFLACEDGPTAVEYAVMLSLIVIVCLTAITSIGSKASSVFSKVANSL